MRSTRRVLTALYTNTRSTTGPTFVSTAASAIKSASHLSSTSLSALISSAYISGIHKSFILVNKNSASFCTSSSSSSTSTPGKNTHSTTCSHKTESTSIGTEKIFTRITQSIEKQAKKMSSTAATKDQASNTGDDSPDSPRSQIPAYKSPCPGVYSVLHPSPSQTRDSSELQNLFDNNRNWAQKMETEYPGFFTGLKNQQKPKYMWIGCSDSRVPATEITGLVPGEIFVHRNVANVVLPTDLNLLSCLQIAIDILKVEHIIICGHYGCAGIRAALTPQQLGISDYWIRSIKDIARHHADRLASIETDEERNALLAELNVLEQVHNVCHTPIVQDAWRRNQPLSVHGWIYGVGDGLLKNLVNPSIKGFDQVCPAYHFDARLDRK